MSLINNRFFADTTRPLQRRIHDPVPAMMPRPTWMESDMALDANADEARQEGEPAPTESEEFPTVNRPEILDLFETAHRAYVRLLLASYPVAGSESSDELAPAHLCDLAIQAQAAAIAMGPRALARLCHIGLDLLYPFDNAVDLVNWRVYVTDQGVDASMYAAIALRIDAELKRIRLVAGMDACAAYDMLPAAALLVCKDRYAMATVLVSPTADVDADGEPLNHVERSPEVDRLAVAASERMEKLPSAGGTTAKETLFREPAKAEPPPGPSTDAFIPAGALRI